MYLISNNIDSEYDKILNKYIKKNICLQDVWINFETNN